MAEEASDGLEWVESNWPLGSISSTLKSIEILTIFLECNFSDFSGTLFFESCVMKQHFLHFSKCLGALQVRFQGLSGMIIMCNAVVIGLETDLESNIWFWVEWLGALGSGPAASHVFFTLCLTHDMLTTSDNRHALLAYFLFELVVRLLRHGHHFFRNEVP